MQDIKIKTKPKERIKKIDRKIIAMQRIKNNVIATQEKIKDNHEENNSAESYAVERIQNDVKDIAKISISKFNEVGRKSVRETGQNLKSVKNKVNTIRSKIHNKRNMKNIVNNKNKIKIGTKKTIKTYKESSKLAKKGIKTTEKVAKDTEKIAKESVKMSKRAWHVAKETAKITAKSIKVIVKATIEAIKAIIKGTKALISLIMAGGWIAVVIILVIVLIGGFIAVLFSNAEDGNYDSSQIPNSEIVFVAKAQIGNVGGDKFWKWYGFNEHVHWCACYVNWCANECGYIEKGIVPKFSSCNEGIRWFKEKNQWHDRSDSYYPMIGDIIFFDWYDDNGNLSGSADHVGIVTRIDIDNSTIYTVEGNTDNKCAERMYTFDDRQVMGYGSPKY